MFWGCLPSPQGALQVFLASVLTRGPQGEAMRPSCPMRPSGVTFWGHVGHSSLPDIKYQWLLCPQGFIEGRVETMLCSHFFSGNRGNRGSARKSARGIMNITSFPHPSLARSFSFSLSVYLPPTSQAQANLKLRATRRALRLAARQMAMGLTLRHAAQDESFILRISSNVDFLNVLNFVVSCSRSCLSLSDMVV
eukprot:9475105-Pyramimonas_sp.AAC.1